MLEVENLSKHFGGVRALENVTFAVQPGEAIALVGRNGSGKSTCLDLITGRGVPSAGAVRVDGAAVPTNRPWWTWHRGVSRTFQRTPLSAGTTCEEYVLTGLLQPTETFWMSAFRSLLLPMAGSTTLKRLRQNAANALERAGLGDKRDHDVASLAHEERRLLELARAVARPPRLLLLDEPAAGLSANAIERLAAHLQELHRGGTAVVVVDHVLDLCRRVTSRVIVLSSGTLVLDGTWDEFDKHAQGRAFMNGGVHVA